MECIYCTEKPVAHQLCGKHYQRWRRTGNPEISQQGRRNDVDSIEQRLLTGFECMPNGCHEWIKGINQYGYPKIKYQGRDLGAHRVAWFIAKGTWPTEELDHLCHTLDKMCVGGVGCRHRRCINVAHLEEVSKVENTRRRELRLGVNVDEREQKEIKRKHSDACGNGHEYTKENTRITKRGHRVCRTCAREDSRRSRS